MVIGGVSKTLMYSTDLRFVVKKEAEGSVSKRSLIL